MVDGGGCWRDDRFGHLFSWTSMEPEAEEDLGGANGNGDDFLLSLAWKLRLMPDPLNDSGHERSD